MLAFIERKDGCVHYILKADEGAARNVVERTSSVADGDESKFVGPLSESSFDLHHGLDMSEAEIDTVPAEL